MKKIITLFIIGFCLNANAQIINTVAGNGTAGFSGDGGPATSAELNFPISTAFDAAGNMYIADYNNYRIRKISVSGIITTIAGNGTAGFSGDGGPATSAKIQSPYGVAVDAAGTVYISDQSNQRIRKVNTSGIISTFAGNGTAGYSGDGGPATSAELNIPWTVTVDATGNVYVADRANQRIRKINASGVINTIAGTGTAGFSGDGGAATAAQLNFPTGIAFDGSGDMFIADYNNYRIRKVDAVGTISSIAGSGTAGFSGDGGIATSAKIQSPYGVAADASGNVFIDDYSNQRVRVVNAGGIINTFAGNGTAGFAGDGGLATAAELNNPYRVTYNAGILYIADRGNQRIRSVPFSVGIEQLSINNEQPIIYPNPTSDQFFVDANTTDKLNVDLYDVNGRHVFSKSVSDKTKIDVTTLNEGVYSLQIKTAGRVINKKLVILR